MYRGHGIRVSLRRGVDKSIVQQARGRDPGAEERFSAIPRVETVTRVELRYTIRGRGDDLVTEVIRCLSENRIRVTDFRTILPNLEDVFLKLTGHSIRE